MWGAGLLAAEASARVGAGYTYLLASKGFPLKNHPDFLWLSPSKIDLKKINSVAIGPGFKKQAFTEKTLKALYQAKFSSVVIDAEALTVATRPGKKLLPGWIITPHEGELARMMKVTSDTIRRDRKAWALKAAKKWQCIVLLKGHHSLIASPERAFEISSGNASLAKAGTGDVLTGMIAGFLSQGLPSIEAACLAAYIHGMTADLWVAQGNDVLSLMASDVIRALPKTLARIRISQKN